MTSDEDMSHDDSNPSHFDVNPYEQAMQPPPVAAASFSYEPLPYDYQPRFAAAVPQYSNNAACDRVLDEAVEELFMDMPSSGMPTESSDPLDDFVQDWVPQDAGFAATLENDAALGFMLEKLLEE